MPTLTDETQPPRALSTSDALAAADARYNYVVGVVDGVGWPLSMAFFSTATLLPAFLLRLHAGLETIGWLSAVLMLGYMMPSGLVAARTSRLPMVRGRLFSMGIVERVPLFFIALLTAILGANRPNLLIGSIFVLLAIHSIALGTNQTLYWRAIAKVIPTKQRGRMFGLAGAIGGCLGFGVEPVSRFFLLHNHGNNLNGYALCFFLGACIQLVTFLPFGWLRETPSESAPLSSDPHAGHYFRDSIRIWRENAAFRLFLISGSILALASAAQLFLYAAAIARYHLGAPEIALFTTINAVVGAFGSLAWGAIADRAGNKVVLVWSGAAYAIGIALAVANPTLATYAIVFGLTSLGSYGWSLAGYNILLEFAASEQESSFYVAISNGSIGVIRGIAPILGGIAAQHLSYSILFAACAVLSVVAVVATLPVKEPRDARLQQSAA